MADEVSAALLGEMRAALALKTETDARIGAIRKKLNAQTATQADIADYSDRLGELLRDTLRETLTPEALPNETLYYNILRDTVGVMLKNAHRKVNEAAIEAQKAIDEAKGLHLNAEAAPYPQKRADDLFYKVGAPGTPYETAMKRLAEPVATLTQAFHDDHIRHNADKRFRAGMGPKIVRTAAFNCCGWCSSLAGTYDYEDVRDTGNDVFRRHERCKCIVDYVCDGKKQDVWSKKMYAADEETLGSRDAYRASTGDASQETLHARSEYGLDQHRKTPEEMQAEYDRIREEKALAKSEKYGKLDIEIDEFVPCLKDAKTEKILQTEVRDIPRKSLKFYTESNGWGINWVEVPKNYKVLGVFIKGQNDPQGMISLRYDKGAVYMSFASTAPQNNKLIVGENQKYKGVGGHLFAAAVQESVRAGNLDGCVYGYAANEKLLDHYIKTFGAFHYRTTSHEYTIEISGHAAQNLLDIYTFDRK